MLYFFLLCCTLAAIYVVWKKKTTHPMPPPLPQSPISHWDETKKLNFRYMGGSYPGSTRTVYVLNTAEDFPKSFIAHCTLAQEERTFRFDRCEDITDWRDRPVADPEAHVDAMFDGIWADLLKPINEEDYYPVPYRMVYVSRTSNHTRRTIFVKNNSLTEKGRFDAWTVGADEDLTFNIKGIESIIDFEGAVSMEEFSLRHASLD